MSNSNTAPVGHALWRWAEGIMHGSGASTRSGHRAAPRLHILARDNGELVMWCSNGKAMPFVSIRSDYCPKCLELARDMWERLNDDEQ